MDSPPEIIPSPAESRCGTSPPGTPYFEAELVPTPSPSPPPKYTEASDAASAEEVYSEPAHTSLAGSQTKSGSADRAEDKAASLGASAEQEPAPRSSTPSNTSLPSDQRAKVAGTPVKPTISSTGYHTGIAITGSEGATELRRDQYAREMNMKCAELDLEDFLSKFMPVGVNGDIPPSLVDNLPSFDRKVLLGTAENPICEALCAVSQKIFDGCDCPADQKLVAGNTSRCPDTTDRNDYAEELKGDVCFYPAGNPAESAYKRSAPSTPYQASTAWAWVSLLVEIKTQHHDCPFGFELKDLRADSAGAAPIESGETATAHESGDGDVGPAATALGTTPPGSATVASDAGSSVPSAPADAPNSDLGRESNGFQQTPATQKTKKTRRRRLGAVPFLSTATLAQRSLGQIAEYVNKISRRQHRLHVYTLYIYAGQARIIRWDRAGAVVSTPFDFEKEPFLLHRIIWRYAWMTREQRGHDPTAVLATQAEIEEMRACKCEAHERWIATARDESLNKRGWPVYKITVSPHSIVDEKKLTPIADDIRPEEASNAKQSALESGKADFIVGRRHFASSSPTGRGTKCYIAYDMSGKRLVFLKDYWRSYVDDNTSPAEGKILEHLRTRNVKNVPTPLAYEDVGLREGAVQQTRTQEFLPVDERTGCKPTVRRHHRLVMKEIGQPLETHRNARELVRVLKHALKAHQQAWEQKVLHRDISVKNIIVFVYIDRDGKKRTIGVLIDWDLAKFLAFLHRATQPGRSGTWQFMSAALLRMPGKKHEVADDLEAFIHVLRWMCLRFYDISIRASQLRNYVFTAFDNYSIIDGEEVGGDVKLAQIVEGVSGFSLGRNTALGTLLRKLALLCQEHYLAAYPTLVDPIGSGAVPTSHPDSKSESGSEGDSESEPESEEEADKLPLQVSTRATPPPTQQPPMPTHHPVLSSHDEIIAAFTSALQDKKSWERVVKGGDRFAAFKDSPLYQMWRESSSIQSSVKRSRDQVSEGLHDKARPTKLARIQTGTGTPLESVEEEAGR